MGGQGSTLVKRTTTRPSTTRMAARLRPTAFRKAEPNGQDATGGPGRRTTAAFPRPAALVAKGIASTYGTAT